ncbi:exosortase system-associated protein, TIGR04073 family [Methylomonas methanica]|uniref:Exosortase system-associated protein, TIGR04073 family n=1 Tax=Methylomonas methanica (strain DSM 25384 / MC09) TaxID=857087 RepID=G0A2C3_METMM|nr:exosortase system-associated protein, TIGR04073 family [Methylomonas methanica]AEF98935.1 hypothetical protein Metme_0491 [Methylomonas methanica MC09]
MKYKAHGLACIMLIGFFIAAAPARAETVDESYGQIFGRKVLSGLANITTSVAEIPKNIIIVNNQSNFAYGLVGGSFKGLLHMVGRIGVGVVDLISSPIPTYPIVYPNYVWDDFYAETTYGPAMVGEPTR